MALNVAQKKSLRVGLGLILAAALLIIGIWCGTYIPGFVGEIFSMIAGIMWSPVLLDISLFFIGLILVLWLNGVRRKRDGDEFVYLEQVDDPTAALPTEARSAIFLERPDPADPTLPLAAIEGALDLNDTAEATQLLFALPEDQLDQPKVLSLRLRLAELTGDTQSATSLRAKLP
ncbi:MAG: hypothetical protein OSA48_09630 [Akkermansiaceae bacterium]|nr:hypothetical protein [Akkermansiaceae bacterium]